MADFIYLDDLYKQVIGAARTKEYREAKERAPQLFFEGPEEQVSKDNQLIEQVERDVKQNLFSRLIRGEVTVQGFQVDDAVNNKPVEILPARLEYANIDWFSNKIELGGYTFVACQASTPKHQKTLNKTPGRRGSPLIEKLYSKAVALNRQGMSQVDASKCAYEELAEESKNTGLDLEQELRNAGLNPESIQETLIKYFRKPPKYLSK